MEHVRAVMTSPVSDTPRGMEAEKRMLTVPAA